MHRVPHVPLVSEIDFIDILLMRCERRVSLALVPYLSAVHAPALPTAQKSSSNRRNGKTSDLDRCTVEFVGPFSIVDHSEDCEVLERR